MVATQTGSARPSGVSHSSPSPRVQPSVSEKPCRFAHSGDDNVRLRAQHSGISERFSNCFSRTRARHSNWKLARKTTSLNKSESKATNGIVAGLVRDDFKKVYQGFKRLHAVDAKKSRTWDKRQERFCCQKLAKDCVARVLSTDALLLPALKNFMKKGDINELVDRYSGRKTLFHKMLEGLERAKLMPSSYIKARNDKIKAQHEQIKASLCELQNELKIVPKAMFKHGERYRDGIGVVENQREAALWFKRAAMDGDREAMVEWSDCLRHGKGVVQNTMMADVWSERAAAPENPNGPGVHA